MEPHILADIVALILALALGAYVLFAGADFGGGVWDLFASGPRKGRKREVISHSIAPIWEANHVWLILAIVITFTCFPAAFARLATVLHIPLSLMLVGIVLRGSAFVFRSYDSQEDMAQRRWGRIFAIASLLTPVLLGICIGAVASGRVVEHGEGDFASRFIHPWLTPFTVAVGLLALAMFALLAGVFLTLETTDRELTEDFRRNALVAGVAVFGAAFLALALAPAGAPMIHRALVTSAWAVPFHVMTGVSAVGVLAALWFRKYRLARLAVGMQVLCIIGGWAAAQYPYVIPPDLTIAGTAAPEATLRLILIILAAGAVVLLPSLIYLFRVFKSGPADRQASPGRYSDG
jgi:cytochrome d ubiquinol oxidase subunit II